MPSLLAIAGPSFGMTLPFFETQTLGRATSASIQLSDLQVSRLHATLLLRNGQVWVQDAGSRNGCFVRDERVIGERLLEPLDSLRLGGSTFVLDAPEQIWLPRYGEDAVQRVVLDPEVLGTRAELPALDDDITVDEAHVPAPLPTPLPKDEPGILRLLLATLALEAGAGQVALFRGPDVASMELLLAQTAGTGLTVLPALLQEALTGKTVSWHGTLPCFTYLDARRKVTDCALSITVQPFLISGELPMVAWLARERGIDERPYSPPRLEAHVLPLLTLLASIRRRAGLEARERLERQRLDAGRVPAELVLEAMGLLAQVRTLAQQRTPLLVLGPNGIGKDRLARAVHTLSPYWDEPMVQLSAQSLGEDPLRLELFGAEADSVPGWEEDSVGALEAVGSGTVVLLEVDQLTPALQAELLKVLQTGRLRRSDGSQVLIHSRLIVTSRIAPDVLRTEGTLRPELLSLLTQAVLELPPLEHLKAHYGALALPIIGAMNRRLGKRVRGITQRGLDWLSHRHFALHLWDLEDLLMRAVGVCEGPFLTHEDLELAHMNPAQAQGTGLEPGRRFSDTLKAAEKRLILQALKVARGNRVEAAQLLDLTRGQLDKRILELGVMLEG